MFICPSSHDSFRSSSLASAFSRSSLFCSLRAFAASRLFSRYRSLLSEAGTEEFSFDSVLYSSRMRRSSSKPVFLFYLKIRKSFARCRKSIIRVARRSRNICRGNRYDGSVKALDGSSRTSREYVEVVCRLIEDKQIHLGENKL